MNKPLFDRVKTDFFDALNAKTGWGKEEVKRIYMQVVNNALLEWVDYVEPLLPPTNNNGAGQEEAFPYGAGTTNIEEAPFDV